MLFPIVEPAVEEVMPLPETNATQDDAATDSELQATASEEWSLSQRPDDTAHESEAEEEGFHEHESEEQGMGGGRWPTRDRRPPERFICRAVPYAHIDSPIFAHNAHNMRILRLISHTKSAHQPVLSLPTSNRGKKGIIERIFLC
jgi:hypothetical protein